MRRIVPFLAICLVSAAALAPAQAADTSAWSSTAVTSGATAFRDMPFIASSSDGRHVLSAWLHPQYADALDTALLVARSDDAGATWSKPVVACDAADAQRAQFPLVAVAVDLQKIAVACLGDVAISSDGGRTWRTSLTLPAPIVVPSAFRLVMSADGKALTLLWSEDVTTSAFGAGLNKSTRHLLRVHSSADGGATWSGPVSMVPDTANVIAADVAVFGASTLATWITQSGDKYLLQRAVSMDSGVTWSAPSTIATGSEAGSGFSASVADGFAPIAMLTGTTGAVAWTERVSESTVEVRLQTGGTSGDAWSAVQTIASFSATAGESPVGGLARIAASADAARWIAVFKARTGDASNPRPFASVSRDSGRTWTSPSPLLVSPTRSVGDVALLLASDGLAVSVVVADAEADSATVTEDAADAPERELARHIHVINSLDGGATWSARLDVVPVVDALDRSLYAASSADGDQIYVLSLLRGATAGSVSVLRGTQIRPKPTPTATATATSSATPAPSGSAAPTPTPAPVKKSTITCLKGKQVKKVTAAAPKCPAGWKLKK